MTATVEHTTAALLLEWDRRRPRSQQAELGMSEVGGCRRRAGYRLTGTAPTNPGGSVQAVLGTAIHEAVAKVLHDMQAAGIIPPDAAIEEEVRFAGIVGHFDRYEDGILSDTKTTSDNWLTHIEVHGPDRQHVWQVNLYAAALIRSGRPVRTLVLDYIARDTGRDWQWRGTPDPQQVRDALRWLEAIRAVDVDMLNRDYAPDTSFCQHCPFYATCWDGAVPGRDPRSVLLVEDPDAVRWARQLEDARQVKASAEALEKEAKGALDALRPNESGTELVDVGLPDKVLKFEVRTPERLDTTAVKAEYAKAGATPPTKTGREVRLGFARKPEGTVA